MNNNKVIKINIKVGSEDWTDDLGVAGLGNLISVPRPVSYNSEPYVSQPPKDPTPLVSKGTCNHAHIPLYRIEQRITCLHRIKNNKSSNGGF